MDTTTKLKNAIEFAKKNPEHPNSVTLYSRIKGGMYKKEIQQIKDEKIKAEGAQAEKFMGKSTAGQMFSKETLKEVPGALADTVKGLFVDTPVKIAKSLVDIPVNLASQATGGNYNIPGTYQSEAVETANDIIDGKKPLIAAVKPFVEVPFDVATTAAGAKGLVNAGKSVVKEAPAVVDTVMNSGKKAIDAVKSTVQSAASGVSKKLAGNNKQALIDTISGVKDKSMRIATLEQSGATTKAGNSMGGAKSSLTKGITSEATPMIDKMADDVAGIVKPKAHPVKNLTRLNKEISRISEKEITPQLEMAGDITPISDKVPGWNPIVKRLNDIKKPDLFKTDKTLASTYDLVRKRMIESIKKQKSTVKGLWDARKDFDKVVKEQFGDVAFDSEKNTAIKRAISDMRREVNSIIGERVPSFKPSLDKLSNMYDARYNIAEQFQNLVDKGGWKAFEALNPKKAAALKWGGLAIGGTTAGKVTGIMP